MLLDIIFSTLHNGAIEKARLGFQKICEKLLRCPRLHYLRWGAQKVSGQSAAEVEEQELQGFASDTLTVLEFEANGQTILPPLRPNSTVLTAVLASFNRLGAVPLQLAQQRCNHGASLGARFFAHVCARWAPRQALHVSSMPCEPASCLATFCLFGGFDALLDVAGSHPAFATAA